MQFFDYSDFRAHRCERASLIECLVCGEAFFSSVQLEEHDIESHKSNLMMCSLCGNNIKNTSYLNHLKFCRG